MNLVPPRTKACDHCRQNRVRCDRVQRAPQPCTRCQRRNLDCTYRPSTSARRSPDVATKQKKKRRLAIQNSGDGREERSEEDALQSPLLRRPGDVETEDAVVGPWTPSQTPTADETSSTQLGQYQYQGPSQQIGDVVVSASQINERFSYFFNHMHPNFPFLPQPLDIDKTLQASPLLFWTIMTIASHFHDQALYRNLQPLVRSLIADILYPSKHGVETCQALCLVCLWPFQASDPNDDPYYLYAGLASHFAMRLGLHRPEFPDEYKNIDESELQRHGSAFIRWSTWCACQFVEHQLASKTGVPCGIRYDWASKLKLESAGRLQSALSPIIKHHILLCELRDRYVEAMTYDGLTLSGLTPPAERVRHLKLFRAALNTFGASHTPMDTLRSIFLHSTRVMAAGLFLAEDLQTFADDNLLELQAGVISAEQVLNLTAPLAWETLPVHVLRAVLHAGVFAAQLRRLRTGPPSGPGAGSGRLISDDQLLAIIRRATDILRHLAFGNDFPTRGKIVLETQLQQPLVDTPTSTNRRPGVVFQTRMGAGMYWDLVENEKDRHNWNQDAKAIFSELLESGVYTVTP